MKRPFRALCLLLGTLLAGGCMKTVGNLKIRSAGSLTDFRIEQSLNPGIDRDIVFTLYDNHRITAYATAAFDVKNLKATFRTEHGTLSVAGVEQVSGRTGNDFSEPVVYTLEGENGQTTAYTVHLVPYTGLPVVTITTVGEREVSDREQWLPGMMHVDGMGLYDDFSDSLYVRGRGNGSWKFPKKPFNAKLYAKSPLLGMPRHKRWCFLANYRDRTLLRNDLTLGIGQWAEGLEWTPHGVFAEVIFNGRHQGNFFVAEHIRADKNRVPIREMQSADTAGESLTGGYLLELDTYYDETNRFRTALGDWPVNLKSPDDDVCVPEQLAYIRDCFNEVERMLHDGEFDRLYASWIDAASFADYYLVETLSGNTETASVYSVYCYKKRNGKFYAGPLWDFDLSAFTREDGTTNSGTLWYKYLLRDPAFVALLRERYAVLKPKIDAWAPGYIREQARRLQRSADENWKLWEINTAYLYNRLNGDETMAYDEAVARLVRMFEARSAWLEQYLSTLRPAGKE